MSSTVRARTFRPEPADRWRHTWSLIERTPPPGLLKALVERHRQPPRAYHHLGHVLDCLSKAEASREIQRDPAAVDLALWFHDAVYDPKGQDNEGKSAALARELLVPLLSAERVTEIERLILATLHDAVPEPGDAAVVVDIDLSILGAPPETFDAYGAAIREEYSWVPGFFYRRKRRKILRSFLARERIFTTDLFHELYEEQARENLGRAVKEL